MTTDELLLEIGSKAYADLTTQEIHAIVTTYSSEQKKMAGMKAFELLWKKFQANYKMGRMYEAESQKYEAYHKIFVWYTQQVQAGKLGHDDDLGDTRRIHSEDWLKDTHDTQDVVDAAE
jgi:hypothetical protein